MIKIAGIFVAVLLGILAIFQLLLIMGLPLGEYAWGGQSEVLPTALRVGSIFSIAIYAFVAVVILQKAGIISLFLSRKFVNVASWVIAGYFCLGILLNLASRSTNERLVMTPVVLILAICTLYISKKSQ